MKFFIKGLRNSQTQQICLNAKNVDQLKKKAYALGIVPIEITPLDSKKFSLKSFLPYHQELLLSFRQISFMINAALPIDEILTHMITSTHHPKIKSMYEGILKELSLGSSLAKAFSKFKHIVGEMRISMIEVGQNSGSLAEIFSLLSDEIEQSIKDIASFKKKLFYPCIVFICIFIAFGILNATVIPEFIALFQDIGLALPFATKTLIIAADVFQKWGISILIFMFLFGFFLQYPLKKYKSIAQKFHQYILKIPLIGKIFLYRDLHHYLLTFYLSQKTGLDIKICLKNAHTSIKNTYLKNILNQVHFSIQKGENLSKAISQAKIFSPIAQGLILAGEKSGNLEKMLEMSSFYYKELYTQKLDNFSQWIEPVMTLLIGALVLWFGLGVLMPMWSLNYFEF
ncbi:type II secretion system F family protein [Helicobacter sp. 11S03491-1]|uniref:type II secretion system F family protein n=1 Tax=Helicobacter sp. 11S03491-1 TaxID=1476196 RepID=UPI000BA5DB65|nr:type II secretion system F family protein [Helicobacter sp. 11S03491-1]PAF41168.1 hypothetical protein BKH45_08040 [Helicobacter sp. 11S03491-1]